MNLIELHILQSFPVTCLNRDDVGAPKSAFFGGCQRARVSSQCWKRAIRTMAKTYQPAAFAGDRTRFVVRELEARFADAGRDPESALALARSTAEALGKLDDPEKGNVKTLLYFSPMELDAVVTAMLDQPIDEILNLAAQADTEDKKAQKQIDAARKKLDTMAKKASKALGSAVKDNADVAIFGRMVADDHSLMLEGAGLFSHALSTHAAINELDFFSAVDDKNIADRGSGHMGTLELNSACYYRYIGLNLDLLADADHLKHFPEAERAEVVRNFLKAAILAVPPARKNSMFGDNPPGYILGLRRTGQPLSLVNAFETPVHGTNGYLAPSTDRLREHWENLKTLYCLEDGVTAQTELPPANINELVEEMVR